jgi:hypothetical protein
MPIELDLTNAHIGYITAAIQRERQMRSFCARASRGGQYRQITPNDKPTPAAAKFKALEALWNPVLDQIYAPKGGGTTGVAAPLDTPNKPPPPPPNLPAQLGPFIWQPFVFDNTDCYGQMQVTLYSNGGYNFSGCFTDPDIYDLDDSLVFGIMSSTGVLYTFTHSGSMSGWGLRWAEGGSETDCWNNDGVNAAIQGGWADLCAGWSWQAQAAVNWDPGSLLKALESIFSAVETIASVVAVL